MLRHPTAAVADGSASKPTVEIENLETFCAGNGGLLEVSANDPDFDFSSIEVSWRRRRPRHQGR